MANYHFITHWRVEATCAEIYDILKEADDLQRWWPSVYLNVITIEKGDVYGLDKVVQLYTKGFLPYTLNWKFRVTEVDHCNKKGFALEAFGDLVGKGIWKFEQENRDCLITYDWELAAEKPLLKHLSLIMKPLFSANHHWAMRKGLQSLKLELRRRAGETSVPKPPQPTFPHNLR